MKRRFRFYARKGWEVVEVSRANLYKWSEDDVDFGDTRHYKEIRTWCNDRFPKDSWEGTITHYNGVKKFAFKNPKYATMFRLQWL
jgi:hypothetical protein